MKGPGLLLAGIAIGMVFLSILARSRSEERVFDFSTAGETRGWRASEGRHRLVARDGVLRFTPGATDAALVWDSPLPANTVSWIDLRMRWLPGPATLRRVAAGDYEALHGVMEFGWSTEPGREPGADGAWITTQALHDALWHEVRLRVGGHPRWRGQIRQVALTPLDVASPLAQVEIERMAFLASRPSPLATISALAVVLGAWLSAALLARVAVRRRSRPFGAACLVTTTMAAVLTLLVGAELGLSVAGYEDRGTGPIVGVVADRGTRPVYDDLFSGDTRTIWTQRPGAVYRDGERINAMGLRGTSCRDAPGDAPRVVALGDSSTFGLGLLLSESYPARLEALLATRRDDRPRVSNAGVIGHSLAQGLALFESRIVACEPAVAILGYGAVNEHYAVPAGDLARIAALRRMPYPVLEAAALLHRDLKSVQWLTRLPTARAEDIQRVPRVSPAEFRELLDRFVTVARARNVAVVLASFPRRPAFEREFPGVLAYTLALEQAAAELGVPLVDLRGAFLARGEERLLIDDVHPTAQGQELVAELLAPVVAEALAVSAARWREHDAR